MQVPLLDLKRQYVTIQDKIEKSILTTLRETHYILGEKVKELEDKIAQYVDAEFAVGVASGSDALVLALRALEVGNGDEVITTPFTFFATAGAITRVGATPVFVDIDSKTYNIDPTKIEEKITEKTKAIIAVHIFGQSADMDKIMEIAKKHNIYVVEDAAQAIGAEYKGKKIGSIGDVACFSFFPSKNLGGIGDGGIVTTNSEQIYTKVKSLRNHGQTERYVHTKVGYNSRLDELQAAALLVKLPYLAKWTLFRRENAAYYTKALAELDNITLPFVEDYNYTIFNQYTLQVEKRDEMVKFLKDNGIGVAIYYPIPLHLQKCYEHLGYKEGDLPIAEEISKRVFSIPIFPELTKDEKNWVIDKIKEFLS